MSERKQYDTVTELVDDLVEDEVFKKELEEELAGQSLATTLFSMRCAADLTQEEMAGKLGTTQSYVSKLEHATTDKITVRALEEYANALGLNLVVMFQRNMTAANSVKYHFFEIKRHLDRLLELAKDDAEIRKGVDAFYNEWLLNTIKQYRSGKSKLAKDSDEKGDSALRVVGPEHAPDQKELDEFFEKAAASGS